MKMLTLLGIFIFGISAHAISGRTTYQAKIVKPDGYPLEASSVNFRFTILDPAASCVLYIEDYAAVNMTGTGGLISFALGAGTRSYPVSSTTLASVFDNATVSFPCQSPGIYNPTSVDNRKIVMQFQDSSGWQTLPAMAINAVPYAMYAGKSENAIQLNGKSDTAFVENATLAALNCNVTTHAITFNGVSFSCIPVGSGSSGITSVTTSGTVLSTGGTASAPVISITAATMSSDGYLTSLDYAEFKAKLSASSTQIVNTLGYAPVSGAAVATQINNSNLSGDVSGTISSNSVVSVGGKTATQVSTSVDDTLAATSSSTADTIVKRNSSGNFTANDIYANAAKINYVDIYKPSTSFNIRLQAPTSLAANYTLNLPTASGTSGQVLSTDGSGNLSWINPTTGSVVSVSATAPLASTGGSNPTISITQSSSSTDGYLSSTDFNTFNNKQAATSAAIIATLGYTPADNAASGTYAQKANNLSDLTNVATARVNLGLGTFATASSIDLGSASATGIIAEARLQTQTNVTSGTQYTKVTVDGKGRVTSGAQISSSDVTSALGYTPSNAASAGITTLNGSSSATQTFAIGTSGNSPAFNTAAGTHTLNIPLANTGSVTAGLLSNTDYTTFNNKQTATSAAIIATLGYTPADNAASGTYLVKASDLSDLTNVATARSNLGLGTFATASSVDLGSASATGTLAIARLPSFNGDATIAAASNTIVLSNSGVTAGTYTKLTVDAKGRVTSSAALASSDVTTALGYTPANSASGVTSLNGSASQTQTFATANTGTAFGIATSNGVHTISIPLAASSSVVGGLLSNADYATFTNKQNATSAAIIATLGYTPANATSATQWTTNGSNIYYNTGNIGVGIFNPTAKLELASGTASVAPLKFTSGTLLSSAQSGTMEYDGFNYYLTDSTNTRRTIATGSSAGSIDNASTINSTGNISMVPVGSVIVSSTTVSTNSNTGALVVKGGLGVAGNINTAGNLNVSGSSVIDGSLKLSTMTSGSMLFAGANGTVTQDNSNLYWDEANKRLGIGSNSPAQTLSVSGTSYFSGNVGIGTTTPVTKLDVSGGVRIGAESTTCAPALAGTLRYNASNVEYCNGISWQAFGVSGSGITNFNGSTSGTQSFTTGTGGTAPNINTLNGVHTLNLPLANTGSVTAGLISNTDYTMFTNKITSSAASIAQVLGYIPADNSVSGTYAQKANNLSDLTNITTARINLGLGTFATASSIDLGSASATGTLAIARLPAFTGDATITAASNTIILSNSGVTAGTYTKVTVDAKGRVTSSAALASSDVTTALGYTPANSATIVSSQWLTSGTNIYYNTGNVGVGTAAPEEKIHVSSGWVLFDNLYGIRFKSASGTVTNALRTAASDQLVLGSGNWNSISFHTGSADKMLITSAGTVGIGTTNPSAKLHLSAGTSITAALKFTSGTLLTAAQSGSMEYDGFNFYVTDSTNTRRAIATGSSAGTIDNASNINSAGNINLTPTGSVIVSSTTTSTNSSTGALVVKGGLGVAENLNVAGTISGSAKVLATGFRANQGVPDNNDSSANGYAFGADGDTGMFSPGTGAANGVLAFYGNNAEVMRLANGKVGIGTTSPDKQLTMHSTGLDNYIHLTSSLTGTTALDGVMIGTGSAGDAAFYNRESTNMLFLTSNTERVRIDASGNVGIGTTTPTARLHLVAGTSSKASFKLTSGTLLTSPQSGTMEYDGTNFYLTDGSNTRRAIATGSSAGSIDNASVINSSGNITMVPVGSVVVSSTTASTDSQTGALVVKGGVGVAGNINTAGDLSVSGATTLNATTIANAADLRFVATSGSPTDPGDVVWYNNDMTERARIYSGTGASPELKFNVSGVTRVAVNSSGHMGVGTTTPGALLHLSGASQTTEKIRLSGQEFYQAGNTDTEGLALLLGVNRTGNRQLWIGDSAKLTQNTSNTILRLSPSSGDISALATDGVTVKNLLLNANGGNVGIGTSLPTTPLEVKNSIIDVSSTVLRLTSADGGFAAGQESQIDFNQNSTLVAKMGMTYFAPDWGFNFYGYNSTLNTTPIMTMRGNGNVGIGTSAPTTNLDIVESINGDTTVNVRNINTGTSARSGFTLTNSGTTYGSDSAGLFLSGTGHSNGEKVSLFSNSAIASGVEIVANASTAAVMFSTQGLERMRVTNTGNVGIGTTTPANTLDVSGTLSALKITGTLMSVDNRAVVDTPETSSSAGMLLNFKNNSANSLNDGGLYNGVVTFRPYGNATDWSGGPSHQIGFTTNGNLFHRYGSNTTWNTWRRIIETDASGRVGIGTTAPSYTLDVSGTLRVKGTAYTDGGYTTWTAASDIRLKDIHGNYNRGLDDILGLDIIRFQYKSDNPVGLDSSKEFVGVTAQNLQQGIPEAVTEETNGKLKGYLTINTTPVLWTLVNAVKQLYKQVMERFEGQDRQIASIVESKADKAETDAKIKMLEAKAAEVDSLKVENAAKAKEIDALKSYLCSKDPTAPICK